MAYIDKIKSGKKTFYYLGKTIRISKNKWKKIRIKLGEKKPTKEKIGKKLTELKLEEYKVYNKNYLDADKLEIIDDFKEVYNNHLKKIPKTVAEKEEADFVIRFTYNSNAIEGNRLTLRDTYLIIKEKQIPSGAPPKDYNEAINGREAFEFIKKYKGKLTTDLLEKINLILTKNTGVIYPGRIRFFPVKIEGTDFTPPEPEKVKPLLEEMIKFYYENKRKIHPFILACLIHAQCVEIHPFEDGNGRTGRALMNWILMEAGYPKVFVPVKSRQKYYEAIDLYNEKGIKDYCEKMFEVVMEQFHL
ncbi:MAG: Fic family protein [Nanoarchaeota archaeon]|nr:Fic family protein [Nanoarchaeota archaeon]MBU1643724.1 Fic family protein [Nanoarchaeota archaeon]MBU1976921.1 Fic family protein [Nanoarchaeota archaeon]